MLQDMLTEDVALSFKSPAYEFHGAVAWAMHSISIALDHARPAWATHNGHTPEIEVRGDQGHGALVPELRVHQLEDNFAPTCMGSAIYQDRYIKRASAGWSGPDVVTKPCSRRSSP